MKKLYSFLAVSFATASIFAQAFTATYDFSTIPTELDSGTKTGSNFTTSTFSTVGSAYVSNTANRYANTNAPLTGLDAANYIQVTVTPATNYNVTISTISFRLQRSSTGPRDFVVRSSADGYTTNLPASISPANPNLSILPTDVLHFVQDVSGAEVGSTITPTNITTVAGPVTLRIYPFNAEAASGTYSVDDFFISGTVNAVLGVTDLSSVRSSFVQNTFVENELNFGARADVKVYAMNGQVMKSAAVSENKSLDVADLAPGMYIVTGMVNGQPVSEKILKK